MSPNEYEYRELQKMNEHLRRENHLLRLLDELQREVKDTGASTSVPVPGSQDTLVGDAGEKSCGDGSVGTDSQGTLVGDVGEKCGEDAGPSNEGPGKDDREEVGQEMDVDAHGDKTEDEHKQPGDKQPGDKQPGDNEEKAEEEEEEENSQYDESNASDVQSESTRASNATDEDSKDQEEQLLRELHRCNPLAHRNAVLSMYKRDTLLINTMTDYLHIQLHQELQSCFGDKFYTVGYCKLDASLYMASESNPAKRTDVSLYKTLYGLHPAFVSWIDYQPTLRLLDRHAEMKICLKTRDWNIEFMKRFDYFIEVLERAGCLSGYLDDDTDTPDEHAYKISVATEYKRCVEAFGR